MSNTNSVFVCGAGHQGLSMAAHLALNGLSVNIWNRTSTNISKIQEEKVIHCSGVINGDAKIAKVSSAVEDVFTDFIMVTTPSSAHKDIAKLLAPYVTPRTVIILNPGRTFGAIEFAEELIRNGVNELPQIAETQTIVYTCRKSGPNSTTIFALKNDVKIAAIRGSDIKCIIDRLPRCLKSYFSPVESVALTSLSNVGMVLHCAPVIMNVGWIECDTVEFKYYYDGISKSVSQLLERIDQERCSVAKATGYNVESLRRWLQRTYLVTGDTIYECIRNNKAYNEIDAPKSLNTRYIFEDVPNGLVPIETMGRELGIKTPIISLIIDMASYLMNQDFRSNGRQFSLKQLERYF